MTPKSGLGIGSLCAVMLFATVPPLRAGPFPWFTTNHVDLVNIGNGKSADAIAGDPFSSNTFYCSKTGNGWREMRKYMMLRNAIGEVTGAVPVWASTDTLPGQNSGLKAIEVFSTNALYYTMEDGGIDADGNEFEDGLIALLTNLALPAPSLSQAANLSGVRTGGEADFDPEGLAIDRVRQVLYVMTDDGPNTDVAQYAIDASTLALTHRWTTTMAAGVDNGNDGIVLSDGRVATVACGSTPGSPVGIYAVSTNGMTVTDLLNGQVGASTLPQDLLEFDGYLYLLLEEGTILAFDAADLDHMQATPAASWDLNAILGISLVGAGCMGMTTDYHLLVGTRGNAGSQNGHVYLFRSTGPPRLPPAPVGLHVIVR